MNLSKMTRDMTEGSIAPKLLFFAFPIMFSSLFHLVYSLADSLVVGRFIGGNALAAVSVTGNATYLMFSISGGINMGSSVVLAQAYGARDQKKMKQVISTSVAVLGITAVLFTLIGMLTADLVLHIIQTPEEIYGMAKSYMMIIFAGTLGSVFYNWLASLLRAFGNFVLGFGMGIEGAALATVLSQILSGLLCFAYAWKQFPVFHLKREEWTLDKGVLKKILLIGIPAAVQNSIITVSNMVLQGVLNTYGTTMVLAYGIVSKYELICMQVGDSLGTALSTFAGQNMGAGKMDRVIRSVKTTALLNFAGYAIVSPLIFATAEGCMRIFTDNSQAIGIGIQFLRIYAVFFPALGILILFQNFLRSVGDIKATIWMGICEVISRSVFALGLPFLFHAAGLMLVSPFTWAASMLLGLALYLSGQWKRKSLL